MKLVCWQEKEVIFKSLFCLTFVIRQLLSLRQPRARISKRSGSLSRAVVGYLPEAVSVPMKKAGNFKLDKVPE